jgi:PIN domain nuclease of toxin-antitoxin system
VDVDGRAGGTALQGAPVEQAWSLSWARDPFDRLIVAHARLRGWKLATADSELLGRLSPTPTLPL